MSTRLYWSPTLFQRDISFCNFDMQWALLYLLNQFALLVHSLSCFWMYKIVVLKPPNQHEVVKWISLVSCQKVKNFLKQKKNVNKNQQNWVSYLSKFSQIELSRVVDLWIYFLILKIKEFWPCYCMIIQFCWFFWLKKMQLNVRFQQVFSNMLYK